MKLSKCVVKKCFWNENVHNFVCWWDIKMRIWKIEFSQIETFLQTHFFFRIKVTVKLISLCGDTNTQQKAFNELKFNLFHRSISVKQFWWSDGHCIQIIFTNHSPSIKQLVSISAKIVWGGQAKCVQHQQHWKYIWREMFCF